MVLRQLVDTKLYDATSTPFFKARSQLLKKVVHESYESYIHVNIFDTHRFIHVTNSISICHWMSARRIKYADIQWRITIKCVFETRASMRTTVPVRTQIVRRVGAPHKQFIPVIDVANVNDRQPWLWGLYHCRCLTRCRQCVATQLTWVTAEWHRHQKPCHIRQPLSVEPWFEAESRCA